MSKSSRPPRSGVGLPRRKSGARQESLLQTVARLATLRHVRGAGPAASIADLVVCGWGKLGGSRGPEVLRLIREAGQVAHALKLNQDGSPQHPLYLRSDLRPFPMEVP